MSYAAEVPPSVVAGFPPTLAGDVAAVEAAMPAATFGPLGAFTICVGADQVTVPYRIYNPEPERAAEEALSPDQRTILACVYTRHNDGLVRERRLKEVLATDVEWVVPYVVYLVGEYVIEIAAVVQESLEQMDTDDARLVAYKRFVQGNPAFVDLVAARAMSYWSCYYQWASPNRYDYPGLAVVRMLRSLGDAP